MGFPRTHITSYVGGLRMPMMFLETMLGGVRDIVYYQRYEMRFFSLMQIKDE